MEGGVWLSGLSGVQNSGCVSTFRRNSASVFTAEEEGIVALRPVDIAYMALQPRQPPARLGEDYVGRGVCLFQHGR